MIDLKPCPVCGGNRRKAAECWSIVKATVANAAVMGQLLRAAIARAVTRRWT